jgi:hypothetical protein
LVYNMRLSGALLHLIGRFIIYLLGKKNCISVLCAYLQKLPKDSHL